MSYKNFGTSLAALVLASLFSVNANAVNFEFNFAGECDDCAFNGNPADANFNPLNDNLTQSVFATLSLNDASVNTEGFIRGGSATFSYGGSSLINPFSITDPFLFSLGLLPSGQVQAGSVFTFGSSVNAADPNGDLFNFPNFCTALGQQVLNSERGGCSNVGLVSFELDSAGDFSIFGDIAFDVGSGGQFTPVTAVPEPAAMWLFGIGLIGLFGIAKRNKNVA